jgi:uncharacterized protein YcbX
MITMAQSELPDEPRLLRTLADESGDPLFGVYAQVLVPGFIRQGDSVSLG